MLSRAKLLLNIIRCIHPTAFWCRTFFRSCRTIIRFFGVNGLRKPQAVAPKRLLGFISGVPPYPPLAFRFPHYPPEGELGGTAQTITLSSPPMLSVPLPSPLKGKGEGGGATPTPLYPPAPRAGGGRSHQYVEKFAYSKKVIYLSKLILELTASNLLSACY